MAEPDGAGALRPAASKRVLPTWRADVAFLVLLGSVLRIAMALVYEPQSYPDTGTYIELARHIRDLSLLSYDGARTPGYPLLLLASGFDSDIVWLIQALMGISISILCYLIVATATSDRLAAVLAGAIHSLTLNQIFFEANLLSETLATFLVVLSVAIFARASRHEGVLLPGALALVAALATLTRPTYLVLAPVYFLLLALATPRMAMVRRLVVFSIVFLVPVVFWASVNKAATGQFSLTTLTGYSLSNHAGGFFELAPDKDALIRDTYLKYREKNRAESPSRTHANSAIAARPELLRITGLSKVDLSRELARMSLDLFYSHPLLYARSVGESWASFWAAPNYWNPDRIKPTYLRRTLQLASEFQRTLLRAANFGFVLFAMVTLFTLRRRWRNPGEAELIGMALIGVVICASLLQALVEFGDNPRFAIPTQPLVICFLAVLLANRSHVVRFRSLESHT